jgi:CheY-like chemotaxis protein
LDKVLVVDDEFIIRDLMKTVLEEEGFVVITASDGEEALTKAYNELPDLILLDVMMPGKSGLEVCKILKSQSKTKHIPVVMSTVLGREVDRTLTKEVGADAHFIKPFTAVALLTEVKRQLDTARGSKFSKQLGLERDKLRGRGLLLEFDPSAPYERLIRDFVLECASHDETVVVLTQKASPIRQALENERGVELLDVTPDLMISPIIERHREGNLSIVYDNLTALVLPSDLQTAHGFAQNTRQLLSDPRITSVFLLDPSALNAEDVNRLKELFSAHATYGKQGIANVRI